MTATQWLEMIVSCSSQILVLICVCFLLERAVPRSADRCALWSNCFLCVLLLIGYGLALPRFRLFAPWMHLDPQTLMRAATAETFAVRILLGVWLLGVVAALIRWLICCLWLRFEIAGSRQLTGDEIHRLNIPVKDYQGPRGTVLLVSDTAAGPYCLQLHRPVIVIPRMLLNGPPDDLRNILIHELAHLKGNHPLQLFVEHVMQLVCWFHPAVWRAANRASLVREYFCDDAVLRAGVRCSSYLKTLLHVTESAGNRKKMPAISFGRKSTELILRSQRLVETAVGISPQRKRGFYGRHAVAASLLLIALGLAQIAIPVDPIASTRSHWSSWPTWSARCLHCFGVSVRDYGVFDRRTRAFEQLHEHGAYK